MTRRRLPLTDLERDELLQGVRMRRNNWVTYAPYLDVIHQSLRDAELVPEDQWDDLAALGCVLWVHQRGSGDGQTWLLTMPGDEDQARGRLSVLTPLGWALLGARAGETVHVLESTGVETYVVEQVMTGGPAAALLPVDQPAAAGR